MRAQSGYDGLKVFYTNRMSGGVFLEAVVLNVPKLKYKWQVFILRGGETVYKLYRRSFKGAVKTAEKNLCIPRRNKKKGYITLTVRGIKKEVPAQMEIPVINKEGFYDGKLF